MDAMKWEMVPTQGKSIPANEKNRVLVGLLHPGTGQSLFFFLIHVITARVLFISIYLGTKM